MLAELHGYIPGIFVITMQPRQLPPGPNVQVTPTSSRVNMQVFGKKKLIEKLSQPDNNVVLVKSLHF